MHAASIRKAEEFVLSGYETEFHEQMHAQLCA